jgi:hypothetical protein
VGSPALAALRVRQAENPARLMFGDGNTTSVPHVLSIVRTNVIFAGVPARSVDLADSHPCSVTSTLASCTLDWRSADDCRARGVPLPRMRRALFIAVLALLISDASGLSSLLVPESCAIGADDSAPDNGCPAFCVRCTCNCCVSSVVSTPAIELTTELLPPVALESDRSDRVPTGRSFEILHVPKPLPT